MRRIYEEYAYQDAARAECIWPTTKGVWPALDREARCDVAVVGAGYTGLSAALHLAEAGRDVTVLDAEFPGWGASGRNGGFCCIGGEKAGLATIARRFGQPAATAFFATQCAAIDLVADLCARHGIDVDRHSDGEVQLAHRPQAFAGLRAEQAELADLGVYSTLLDKNALVERGMKGGFHGGLHIPVGFALNPGKYVSGLARAADQAGATLFAQSPVRAIQRDGDGFLLRTPNGHLRAKRLIMATNGYGTDRLPDWMTGRYLPVQSNILMTRPLSDDEIAAQGWSSDQMAYDTRNLLHYFRLLPDRRFLFGARGNIAASARGQAEMRKHLRADLDALFPAWRGVETPQFWSGLISMSRDLLPYAGPIGDWDNAWAGMNYHGNGVALSTWTGARLAEMALGRDAVPALFKRRLPRFPFAGLRRSYLRPAFWAYRLKDGPPPK